MMTAAVVMMTAKAVMMIRANKLNVEVAGSKRNAWSMVIRQVQACSLNRNV